MAGIETLEAGSQNGSIPQEGFVPNFGSSEELTQGHQKKAVCLPKGIREIRRDLYRARLNMEGDREESPAHLCTDIHVSIAAGQIGIYQIERAHKQEEDSSHTRKEPHGGFKLAARSTSGDRSVGSHHHFASQI